jgi:hypothetical protein
MKRSLNKGAKSTNDVSIFLRRAVAAGACSGLTAQSPANRIRNVVLVHGAWADGSEWKAFTTFW